MKNVVNKQEELMLFAKLLDLAEERNLLLIGFKFVKFDENDNPFGESIVPSGVVTDMLRRGAMKDENFLAFMKGEFSPDMIRSREVVFIKKDKAFGSTKN